MTLDNKLKLADIVVKGVLVSGIGAVVALYGNAMEDQRSRADQATRGLQASIEMTSRQKELDVDLSLRLFGTLMTSFFSPPQGISRTQRGHEQILLLRLVALNFQDVPINLKPLFEDLEGTLVSDSDRRKLRQIAMEVSNRQAYRLTAEPGGVFDSGLHEVSAGDTLNIPELLTTLIVESVKADRVVARLESRELGDRNFGPFEVSYFDSPLVDNAKLGDSRIAVVLGRSDGKTARVRVVAFPHYLAGDRIDVKELSQKYRDQETRSED